MALYHFNASLIFDNFWGIKLENGLKKNIWNKHEYTSTEHMFSTRFFFLYIFCRGQFYMLLVKAKENESSTTWEKLESEISAKRGNPSIKEL